MLCFKITTVEGNGRLVIIDVSLLTQASVFYTAFPHPLLDSIKQWRTEGHMAVWLHVPILQSRFIAAAAEQGFAFHHAESDCATLTLWLGEGRSRLPSFASHQVGVAGEHQKMKCLCKKYLRVQY